MTLSWMEEVRRLRLRSEKGPCAEMAFGIRYFILLARNNAGKGLAAFLEKALETSGAETGIL